MTNTQNNMTKQSRPAINICLMSNNTHVSKMQDTEGKTKNLDQVDRIYTIENPPKKYNFETCRNFQFQTR